ncbi:MAG: Mov34/MPN/PAD-1 family protein, partial [Candidatus Hodarchaeota archaeon]
EVHSRDIGRKGPETHFVILCVKSDPSSDQCINHAPISYFDLSELLKQRLSIHLDEEIFNFITASYGRKVGFLLYKDKHPIIVICIPRLNSTGVFIGNEIVVFHVESELKDLGKALGCIREKYLAKEKKPIYLLQKEVNRKTDELKKIRVFPFSAVRSLSKRLATEMADITTDVAQKSFSVIGLGALGSQVVLNLVRQGFSNWKLIDSEILLPHNFARHGLSAFYRGTSKAVALKQEIDVMLENPKTAAIYRRFDALKDRKSKGIFDTDFILDCSASYSVLLALAYTEHPGPRNLSAYYCGAGFTSVLLAESSDRSIRLDDLDLQLKIQGLENPIIRSIYRTSDRNPLVYSTSCASRTTVLPQDLVSIHAGMITRQLKDVIYDERAKLFVNLICDDGYGVHVENFIPCEVVVQGCGLWQFRISRSVLNEMDEYRNQKLPNEIGGVLIGWINSFTRTIYVGRALPAPPDSEERPYSFTRGKEGLYVKIEDTKRISNEDVYYVGEWHSHPPGSAVFLGGDDLRSLERISAIMLEVGLPGVMLIMGEHDELGCYVKSRWEE